jgi:hypothetical protein
MKKLKWNTEGDEYSHLEIHFSSGDLSISVSFELVVEKYDEGWGWLFIDANGEETYSTDDFKTEKEARKNAEKALRKILKRDLKELTKLVNKLG